MIFWSNLSCKNTNAGWFQLLKCKLFAIFIIANWISLDSWLLVSQNKLFEDFTNHTYTLTALPLKQTCMPNSIWLQIPKEISLQTCKTTLNLKVIMWKLFKMLWRYESEEKNKQKYKQSHFILTQAMQKYKCWLVSASQMWTFLNLYHTKLNIFWFVTVSKSKQATWRLQFGLWWAILTIFCHFIDETNWKKWSKDSLIMKIILRCRLCTSNSCVD